MGRAGCDQLDRARGSAEINPELSQHHQSADNTEPTIILSSQSSQQQPGKVEEQLCCLFLTNVSLLLAVLCKSEKWQKSLLVYDTLTGAGWKS